MTNKLNLIGEIGGVPPVLSGPCSSLGSWWLLRPCFYCENAFFPTRYPQPDVTVLDRTVESCAVLLSLTLKFLQIGLKLLSKCKL